MSTVVYEKDGKQKELTPEEKAFNERAIAFLRQWMGYGLHNPLSRALAAEFRALVLVERERCAKIAEFGTMDLDPIARQIAVDIRRGA